MAGSADITRTTDNSRTTGKVSRWIDELALLVLPQRRKRPPWRMLLFASSNGLDVYLPGGKSEPRLAGQLLSDGNQSISRRADRRQVARMKRDPDRLVLRLARDEIIEKSMSVPAEAEDVIAPIVQNQIELISPWPSNKALFDWSTENNGKGQQLSVNVVVAGKTAVDQRLAIAEKHGLSPKIIDFGDDATTASDINLLQQRGDEPVRGRSLVMLLLLLVSIGSLATGGIGLMQALEQREALSWVEERTDIAGRRAAAARKVTGKAARLEARYRLASDEKYRRQPMIGTLEALSKALPDGTWLTRLELRNGNIRIVGHSRDATSLIGQLEASPFFKSVRFAAPVTPSSSGAQFVIEAKATEDLDIAALLKPQATGRTEAQNRSSSTINRRSEQ